MITAQNELHETLSLRGLGTAQTLTGFYKRNI